MKTKMEVKTAKRLLKAANAAADEVLFKFGKEGVEIRQLDPAQVAMVSFNIPKAKFSEYGIPEGMESEMLMFNVKDVLSAVSKTDDTVGIEVVKNKICIKSIGLGATTTFFA
jgi:DNA polymerase III sliding clamp (beta) subunit (PCNA family)